MMIHDADRPRHLHCLQVIVGTTGIVHLLVDEDNNEDEDEDRDDDVNINILLMLMAMMRKRTATHGIAFLFESAGQKKQQLQQNNLEDRVSVLRLLLNPGT